jgi:predicted metal-dependent enzyme (double-stranded beta helix superfamily)
MDPQDRFRIRLHRFKTQIQNQEAQPKIHNHRWWYSTLVLKGGYTEYVYSVEEEDMQNMTAKLKVLAKHDLKEGDTNSLRAQLPHRTVNESDTETCITLFVRGKSIYDTNTVYDPETGKFRILRGQEPQLRLEFESVANMITA